MGRYKLSAIGLSGDTSSAVEHGAPHRRRGGKRRSHLEAAAASREPQSATRLSLRARLRSHPHERTRQDQRVDCRRQCRPEHASARDRGAVEDRVRANRHLTAPSDRSLLARQWGVNCVQILGERRSTEHMRATASDFVSTSPAGAALAAAGRAPLSTTRRRHRWSICGAFGMTRYRVLTRAALFQVFDKAGSDPLVSELLRPGRCRLAGVRPVPAQQSV